MILIIFYIISAWFFIYFVLDIMEVKKPFKTTNIIVFLPAAILVSLFNDLLVENPFGKTLGGWIVDIFIFACIWFIGALVCALLIWLVIRKRRDNLFEVTVDENNKEELYEGEYESWAYIGGFFLAVLLVWYFNLI